MAYDLLITNGTIVDGSGGARFDADVAVQGASVAAIGKLDRDAATVIDAAGKIVCPGFVDPHTHYDAQITWDPLLSSSAEHGVTTVVMGNCGVGIAPCRPAARDWLTDDLVTVEGIDKEVLVEGIKWEWETFPEYLNAADARGSALNLAFLAPITPLRTYVPLQLSWDVVPAFIANSLLICALSLGSQLVFPTLAGYMLSRRGWRGRVRWW